MSTVKIISTASLENAIKNYKPPAKFADYKLRHDWHQSQTSITITIYAKLVLASSVNVSLTASNQLIYLTAKIDNGTRGIKLQFKLPHPLAALTKCTLSATKIELVATKAADLQWQELGSLETDIHEILGARLREKAGTDADALFKDEIDEMPGLEPESKRNEFWQSVEYVDSEDSSLAGIDDMEWVETGKGDEAALPVVPKSEGGVVDDDVCEKMYHSKRKLM